MRVQNRGLAHYGSEPFIYIYILCLSSQRLWEGIAVFEIVDLGLGDGSWSCS